MPLIVEDGFDETVREYAIPHLSVSFVTQAGAWSARKSRSGFVPSTMLAEFTDDADRDMGPLIAAGIVRRGKKDGMQIIPGRGLTVVNADEVEAKKAKVRESGRERSQRLRDRRKAEQAEAIRNALPAGHATPEPVAEPVTVTREKRTGGKKQQVSDANVTRYEQRTQRVTQRPSRARARDFDLDSNQSARDQVSQSRVVNAGAREDDPQPGSAEFRLQVIAAFAAATRIEIDDATAGALAAEVLRKARPPVPHPLGYVLKAIADERDPVARWLPKRPAPPPKTGRPEWCGECDEIDRTVEVTVNGKPLIKRCPNCSGQAPAWEKVS